MRSFVGAIAPERSSEGFTGFTAEGGALLHTAGGEAEGAEASGLEARARSGPIPTMSEAASLRHRKHKENLAFIGSHTASPPPDACAPNTSLRHARKLRRRR
jgi:hypothetical protein